MNESCHAPENEAKVASSSPILPRGAKTIRISCDEATHNKVLEDPIYFRQILDQYYQAHPELFPQAFSEGYQLHGFTASSKKLDVKMRRILVGNNYQSYTLAPSYLMPYMTGKVEEVETALFLRRFHVPYWALVYIYGRNAMYWYRLESALGRNSIVGTTVKDPQRLPPDLSADEKHTKLNKEKVYVATTVGEQCILGASVCASADEQHLTEGYKVFQEEAKNVNAEYQPETVNIDGWAATGLAWSKLFPSIVIIFCFLHAFIKIRDRCKKFKNVFSEACNKVWEAYHAETKRSFCQRIRRLKEWAFDHTEGILNEKLLSLCGKAKHFTQAYDHPNCHRTSNMVDRLMRWMDQYLFSTQYFHGNLKSAEQGIRAWAILRNFQPYSCSIKQDRKEVVCAFRNLNGFMYHDNWLENLMIATSMSGLRQ